MANNEKETAQAEEVVLGPMHIADATAFKAALKKAKEHPVNCGIFAYIADQKKKGKK